MLSVFALSYKTGGSTFLQALLKLMEPTSRILAGMKLLAYSCAIYSGSAYLANFLGIVQARRDKFNLPRLCTNRKYGTTLEHG